MADKPQTETATWRDYKELTKPNVVLLMILTSAIGMFMAVPGMVPLDVLVLGNLGIALCAGAAAAITNEIHIATAATNHFIRHPQVTASFGSTMQRLSKGRFALGLARGVGVRSQMMGLKNATNDELADFCFCFFKRVDANFVGFGSCGFNESGCFFARCEDS